MATKPKVTIQAIAEAAGVSTATVDRVLNSRLPVREGTALRVIEAAERLGYHAVHLMRQRMPQRSGSRTLGFCLQKSHSPFYQAMAAALRETAEHWPDVRCNLQLAFMDSFEPGAIAQQLLDMGQRCDAVAAVAVDHPHVSAAVEQLHEQGKPMLALLSDLSAEHRRGYVGVDNHKRGRTAAWAIHRLSRSGGKVAVLVGSHRYLGQEANEMAFRSALREKARPLDVLDARINLEDDEVTYEVTLDLLARHPDLVGIYSIAGSVNGVVRALTEAGRVGQVVVVCHELTPDHRRALVNGAVDLVIRTPLALFAQTAIQTLLRSLQADPAPAFGQPFVLPFELYTPENV
jgi:LacI family transcriptional regulator